MNPTPLPLTPADLHMLADELELEAERLQAQARAKLRMVRILRDRALQERRVAS